MIYLSNHVYLTLTKHADFFPLLQTRYVDYSYVIAPLINE